MDRCISSSIKFHDLLDSNVDSKCTQNQKNHPDEFDPNLLTNTTKLKHDCG